LIILFPHPVPFRLPTPQNKNVPLFSIDKLLIKSE